MNFFDIFKKKEPGSEYLNRNINYDKNEFSDYSLEEFVFEIHDIFSISGRGTVVVGLVKSGCVRMNDTIKIMDGDLVIKETNVGGIEMFRKILSEAEKGDKCGILLRGVTKDEVEIGYVLKK